MRIRLILSLSVLVVCGCKIDIQSQNTADKLRVVSAGYTGCKPEDNQISNVTDQKANGPGTWNATCGGRTYLCSISNIYGVSGPRSCALAAP
jgi:hypothetical protein